MTLVVAKTFDDCAYILSDSKIVDEQNLHADPFLKGAPKIFPYHHTFVVAFAGQVFWQERLMKKLKDAPDVAAARGLCLENHLESRQASPDASRHTDFILVDQVNFRMWRYADGQEQSSVVFAIGSMAGYSRFQELRELEKSTRASQPESDIKLSAGLQSYSADLGAFMKLVWEGQYDVGGFVIPYVMKRTERKFGFYFQTFPPTQTIPGGVLTPLRLVGSAEEGGMTVEFIGHTSGFRLGIPQLRKQVVWKSMDQAD